MPKEIKKGDSFFHTRDTGLAAALSALDFDFFDPDISCEVQIIKGKRVYTWVYKSHSKHGDKAIDVLRAWRDAENYCEENPQSRIATAIATAKNYRLFTKESKKAPAKIGFEVGDATLWVYEGSEQYKKLSKSRRATKL